MTAGRRHALDTIADLLGLPRFAVRGVERRRDRSYAIVLRPREAPDMPRWARGRRVLRINRHRVEGYEQRSPYVRESDRRARRKQNAQGFAWWLFWRLDDSAPVVERAIRGGDLEAIAELRAAILAAAPEPERGGRVLRRPQRRGGGGVTVADPFARYLRAGRLYGTGDEFWEAAPTTSTPDLGGSPASLGSTCRRSGRLAETGTASPRRMRD